MSAPQRRSGAKDVPAGESDGGVGDIDFRRAIAGVGATGRFRESRVSGTVGNALLCNA